MAGQSDAADDLIAELAKLMAQDAQGESNAAAAPAPQPVYPVRIPGGDAPQPTPQAKADLDFVRSFNTQAAERPAPAPVEAPRAPAAPVAESEPEPFKFDFDFGARRAPSEPVVLPTAARPEPAPAPVAVAVAVPAPAPAAEPQAIDHDSIADLIAAELAVDAYPAPEPVAAPTPAPAVVAAQPSPTPAPDSRQPNPGPGWTPTTVAANLGGEQRSARPALRAVNLQPVARSEQDRFKVPPVFGLATTPAKSAETIVPVTEPVPAPAVDLAPAQAAPVETQPVLRPVASAPALMAAPRPADDSAIGRDPIDEIESLIGRAMRVEFDQVADAEEPAVSSPAVEPRPAPSPALRSLATPTVAPISTAPAPSSLSAADEAVLAAAQATGAQIGWVEAPEVSDTEIEPRQRAERSRTPFGMGMTRAVAGPLVAVTLLLAAGFGLYWVLGLGGRDTGGVAPLLTADATPIKQVAPAVTPDTAATQQSVVFNEIDGVVPGAEEQLVSRDQADVNEVTQVATAVPADVSEEGLANRKVRTVTVRPDGTIVSGEDSIAGSAILPVDRPNVPAVPGAETASPELLAAADPVTPAAEAPAAPVTPTVTPVEPGSTVPAYDLTGNPIAGKTTVVPLLRPAGLAATAPTAAAASPVNAIVDPVNALVQAAAEPIAAIPQPAPVTAAVEQPVAIPGATEVAAVGNDAPAYVQLASQRSESEARQTAQAMVTRYGPLFGGANMEVQRVDLGAKGIYYRVRVPANSIQDANTICTNVKAAGGDCFTM